MSKYRFFYLRIRSVLLYFSICELFFILQVQVICSACKKSLIISYLFFSYHLTCSKCHVEVVSLALDVLRTCHDRGAVGVLCTDKSRPSHLHRSFTFANARLFCKSNILSSCDLGWSVLEYSFLCLIALLYLQLFYSLRSLLYVKCIPIVNNTFLCIFIYKKW